MYFRYASARVDIGMGTDSNLLCRLWCNRMQNLYDVWLNSGDPSFAPWETDIAACPELPVMQALLDRMSGEASQRARPGGLPRSVAGVGGWPDNAAQACLQSVAG